MTQTPHYTVGCSYPTDDEQPWHVRDTETGRIVARFAVATHARDWAGALNDEPRWLGAGPDSVEAASMAREEADHRAEAESAWREFVAGHGHEVAS